MTDFSKVLEQAKDMQDKMRETQQSIKKIEVEGVSGGGSVKISLNGDGELIKLFIAPEVMQEKREIFEDLIIAAHADAKKKVDIIKFDLIVLDIMMPGQSGLEFTNENRKKIETPIILLTAKGEASDRIEGLEIGADDYLAKPFEPK